MPQLIGVRTWSVHEAVDLGLGMGLGIFGLSGGAHWIGVLGGPSASVRSHPLRMPLSFELSVHLDFGRIPVCGRWGMCLRYIGFLPAAEVSVAYAPSTRAAIVASCGTRFIQTYAWTGFSVEPALAARVFW